MIVIRVGLSVGRTVALEKLPPSSVGHPAAGVIYDQVTSLLRNGLRSVAVLGLLMALIGLLAGPSAGAVGMRGLVSGGAGAIGRGSGLSTGPVGGFVGAHKVALRATVALVAAVAAVFWTRPTGLVLIVIALVAALLLVVIEVLAAAPASAVPVVEGAVQERR
jgi:hypothetical protein